MEALCSIPKKRRPNGIGNDLVFTKNNGEVVIFPYGSEAQQSWEKGINLLTELFFIQRRIKLEKKQKKEENFRIQILERDQKIFKKQYEGSDKFYNITQTAHILGVHRQTIYYWIKKGWIKPKKDYRNYPVFTVLDIENIIKWRKTIK